MAQPPQRPLRRGPGADDMQPTGPVFADLSGRRRRRVRVLGMTAGVLLVGVLAIAGVGLLGDPQTPFRLFGAAPAHHAGGQNGRGGGHQVAGSPAPGSASSLPAGGSSRSAAARSRRPTPSPSASRDRSPVPSPTPAPSGSPSPTNKAGKTPPGQGRSKRPHPSPSRHGP